MHQYRNPQCNKCLKVTNERLTFKFHSIYKDTYKLHRSDLIVNLDKDKKPHSHLGKSL